MKVFSIRPGFATNSSSDHVVVVFKGGTPPDMNPEWYFGLGHFIASSESSKRKYMFSVLLSNLQHSSPELDYASALAVCKTYFPFNDEDVSKECIVDHQSVFVLPKEPHPFGRSSCISREFFNELMQFVLRDDVGIIGNDDGSEPDIPTNGIVADWHRRMIKDSNSDYFCKKEGQYWTLFCMNGNYKPHRGTKIRMSFNDEATTPKFSEYPELVDVKITDYCEHACSFCYQNSGKIGKHARMQDLHQIADQLKEMKVFEVAIGGGSPETHPSIGDFVNDLYRRGISVGITVRNIGSIMLAEYLGKVNAIGVSVHNMEEAEDVMGMSDMLSKHVVGSIPDVRLQHVVGSIPEEQLIRLVDFTDEYGVDILLLGWKNTGRAGSQLYPIDLSKVIKETNKYYLRMDSCLINSNKEALREVAYECSWRDSDEGAFSMYIDAVNMTANRSSYSTEAPQDISDMDTNELLRLFRSYHE